jgi:signal peptidase I
MKEKSRVVSWLVALSGPVAVFLGLVVLTLFAGGGSHAFNIPSGSMHPTVMMGDRVFVTGYGSQQPAVGDVIVFHFPKDRSISYIKRVIGLPGDVIEFRDKRLYRNNQLVPAEKREAPDVAREFGGDLPEDDAAVMTPFAETLGTHKYVVEYNMSTSMNADYGPKTVPADSLFVVGDNRDKSSDSRFWGFVPMSDVIGRASKVYFSWDGEKHSVRWERMGKLVN